ncbi:hypothetical protein HJC23_009878 [Cyclotella cryptica]|uniref:Exocyst complex component n=1 Tax=Cyclotella cryptica TaxID=29204 RepID=A0ABD3QAU5_9STRA
MLITSFGGVQQREKAIAERKRAEEAKQRLIGRDPLGIRTKQFDLREIDANRSYLIQQLLHELEAEIQAELALASEAGVEKVNWLEAQRQAILTLVESKKTNTGGEGDEQSLVLPSILPTSPDFDPILFLTLAHRDTSYKELFDSTSRLSRKTDTQVERLQSLVRDNFELFIKCSEGIDVFAENESKSGGHDNAMEKLNHRFQKLDELAEACSEEARKSFKPLLDNANEVRKVQSALAVLQRVAPLMQVPGLMRQHIENASFSSVVKAYRKVLVIDKDHSDVDLLRYVRIKAGEAAQDARHDLELILADESSSASSLLDAVRDLGELLELLEQDRDHRGGTSKETNVPGTPRSRGQSGRTTKAGTFTIDRHVICVRDYSPALGCLLLQTTHFRSLVEKAIANAETSTERLFRGEGPDSSNSEMKPDNDDKRNSDAAENSSSSQRSRDKRWKYETLDTRVSATARAVSLAKNWLPRLIQIGMATQEAEKRRVVRLSRKSSKDSTGATDDNNDENNVLSASYVFNSMVRPSLMLLVQHAAFCSLGCANQGSKYRLDATFGKTSPEKLRTLLQSPLPPTQTAKCALELAELAETIQESNESMFSIRLLDEDGEESKSAYSSPLEGCYKLASDAITMIERRVCIYSFDACARKCAMSASGSGTFDGDSLLQCVQKLSDLTLPDKCTSEVEKGCVLVVQKICEGLTNYVKDRSDAARLRVVAECADALNTTIVDVVREVSYLTNDQSDRLESNLSEIISGLEGEMFDVFLESVKQSVASYASLGLIESDDKSESGKMEEATPFPPYLAGSFLAIVRCRAQVERALREATVRRSEGMTYQFLALQTASDGVVQNICHELRAKLNIIPPSKADTYSIHVLFLINTLKKYLSDEILSLAADTKRMLVTKASAGGRKTGNLLGDGPEGLTALENLERLGRVYVMCLGD